MNSPLKKELYESIFHDKIQQLKNEKGRLYAIVPKNVASFFVRPPQKTTGLPVAHHNTNILIWVRGSTELKILCKPTRREETVKGNEVHFVNEADTPMGKLKIAYSGNIDGNNMKGQRKLNGDPAGDWSAVKK